MTQQHTKQPIITYVKQQTQFSKGSKFTSSAIIRGIGYRVFVINNDFISPTQPTLVHPCFVHSIKDYALLNSVPFEIPCTRYLVVRAGHTSDLYLPLSPSIFVKAAKKDRKITVYGTSKQEVQNLILYIYNYRQPSAYTGRGVRLKHIKPIRKVGKKDKQKGKAF